MKTIVDCFARKCVYAAGIFCGATLLFFVLIKLAPGDPYEGWSESLKTDFGVYQPLLIQYVTWLWKAVQLDLGNSSRYHGSPVFELLLSWYPVTLTIVGGALIASLLISLPLGYWSAFRTESRGMRIILEVVETVSSVPVFILGFLAVVFSHFYLDQNFILREHLTGPGKALFYLLVFFITGIGNGTVIELLKHLHHEFAGIKHKIYMRAVEARAAHYRKHLFRNVAIPILTVISNRFIFLFSGAVIIEYLFRIPGIGVPGIQAAISRDYPLLLGIAAFTIVTGLTVKMVIGAIINRLNPQTRAICQ